VILEGVSGDVYSRDVPSLFMLWKTFMIKSSAGFKYSVENDPAYVGVP